MSYAQVGGGPSWHWFPPAPGSSLRSACGRWQAAVSQLVREPGGPVLCSECHFYAPPTSWPPASAGTHGAGGALDVLDTPRPDLSPIYWRPLAHTLTSHGRSRLHFSPENVPATISACGQELVSVEDAYRARSLPVLCAPCARAAVIHYRVDPATLAGWPAL